MRESVLIEEFKAQSKDNAFFSGSIALISGRQQALENVLSKRFMLPVLLVASIVWPQYVSRLIRKEYQKIKEEHTHG